MRPLPAPSRTSPQAATAPAFSRSSPTSPPTGTASCTGMAARSTSSAGPPAHVDAAGRPFPDVRADLSGRTPSLRRPQLLTRCSPPSYQQPPPLPPLAAQRQPAARTLIRLCQQSIRTVWACRFRWARNLLSLACATQPKQQPLGRRGGRRSRPRRPSAHLFAMPPRPDKRRRAPICCLRLLVPAGRGSAHRCQRRRRSSRFLRVRVRPRPRRGGRPLRRLQR